MKNWNKQYEKISVFYLDYHDMAYKPEIQIKYKNDEQSVSEYATYIEEMLLYLEFHHLFHLIY